MNPNLNLLPPPDETTKREGPAFFIEIGQERTIPESKPRLFTEIYTRLEGENGIEYPLELYVAGDSGTSEGEKFYKIEVRNSFPEENEAELSGPLSVYLPASAFGNIQASTFENTNTSSKKTIRTADFDINKALLLTDSSSRAVLESLKLRFEYIDKASKYIIDNGNLDGFDHASFNERRKAIFSSIPNINKETTKKLNAGWRKPVFATSNKSHKIRKGVEKPKIKTGLVNTLDFIFEPEKIQAWLEETLTT